MIERKSKLFSRTIKPNVELKRPIAANDRIAQKKEFASLWIREATNHKYRYHVETCDDGTQIYLVRPTRSHGLDFEVRVQGFTSRTRKSKSNRPSHRDVTYDLENKYRSLPDLKDHLFAAICDVYDCKEPKEILACRQDLLLLTEGFPIDKILRIIKWLFVEQDLTYWLGSGRNMLMSEIEQSFGLPTKVFVEDMPSQKCRHRKSAPKEFLTGLAQAQRGSGRHKCSVCAYADGLLQGQKSTRLQEPTTACPHGRNAPAAVIEALPRSQAGVGRHKCVICAYQKGFETAHELLAAR